jgi:hypothetical protein
MEAFKNTLALCWLEDFGYSGSNFTWCNKQEGGHFIKERLDQVLANSLWQDLFPIKQVNILAPCSFDHALVHLWYRWSNVKKGKK